MNLFKKKYNRNKIINKKYDLVYPDHVKILDKNNFDDFINKYPLSVVDFWAPWCIHCRTMAPRIRRLSVIFKGKVAFGKIDTSKNQDISKNFKILSIPHLIFFQNGNKISSITGLKSTGEIKKVIDNLL